MGHAKIVSMDVNDDDAYKQTEADICKILPRYKKTFLQDLISWTRLVLIIMIQRPKCLRDKDLLHTTM